MEEYNDKNLIRYEEAIQLHFDTMGKSAWFTLKNYGVVFHMFPWATPERWAEVIEITIGIPAGSEFDTARLTPLRRTIDISAMLDVFDVIRLQVTLLKLQLYIQQDVVWDGKAKANTAKLSPLEVVLSR